MDVDTGECMFCHEGLAVAVAKPENLAFMAHLDTSPPCQDAFSAWRTNMQTDFKGD